MAYLNCLKSNAVTANEIIMVHQSVQSKHASKTIKHTYKKQRTEKIACIAIPFIYVKYVWLLLYFHSFPIAFVIGNDSLHTLRQANTCHLFISKYCHQKVYLQFFLEWKLSENPWTNTVVGRLRSIKYAFEPLEKSFWKLLVSLWRNDKEKEHKISPNDSNQRISSMAV